jgi:hypothetical protein
MICAEENRQIFECRRVGAYKRLYDLKHAAAAGLHGPGDALQWNAVLTREHLHTILIFVRS